MGNGRHWADEERDEVRKCYEQGESIAALSNQLGRSQSAIRRQAHKMSIQYKNYGEDHFSKEEDDFIIKNCHTLTRAQIGEKIGRSEGSISHRGRRLNVTFADDSKRSIYEKDKSFFDTPTLENCYIAGWLATDGWVRPESKGKLINQVGISVSEKDETLLRYFKDATNYEGEIRHYIADNKYGQCELRINGVPKWIAALDKIWNITSTKTHTLAPPDTRMLTDDQIASYLVGAVEGDGSIAMKNGTLMISIVSASPTYIEWVQSVWESYTGVKANIYEHLYAKAYYVSLFGKNARTVCYRLMQVGVHRLHRKWDIAIRELEKHRDVGKYVLQNTFDL